MHRKSDVLGLCQEVKNYAIEHKLTHVEDAATHAIAVALYEMLGPTENNQTHPTTLSDIKAALTD